MARWPFRAEHDELRVSARRFVERELAPHAQEWERAQGFPKDLFRLAGDAGLFGLKFPEATGGSGPDLLADAVVTEELARCGSAGVAAAFGAHKDLAMLYVYRFGTAAQHERWLRPAAHGSVVGAFAVTEPDAGSDVASIRCSARREGDAWVVNGTKTFITNGTWADFIVVAAKTDPAAAHSGITLFVVEAGDPGLVRRRVETLGWRTSQTGELIFDGVRLPDERRLGDVGGGFAAIMENFEWERLVMALAQASGAQRTFEIAMAYAAERAAFGRRVADFQVWRHRFADMATEIEAGRALTYQALARVAAGERALREVAMAKLFTSHVACRVADEALQVHGGAGYTAEATAERAWRDARLGPIGGGTSEIMREIIGRTLGL